jgi:hypothetical protein
MSFYLHESSTNFDDFFNKVVDPVWLANSTAPNAAALRQARQSDRKPPCWRGWCLRCPGSFGQAI